jgi:hypothetical protein
MLKFFDSKCNGLYKEKTIENIKMRQGFNDKIANGILDLLLEAKEYEIEDLELMK